MSNMLTKEQAEEIVRRSRQHIETMGEEERQRLIARIRRAGKDISPEEDRLITKNASSDPDNPPLSDEWLDRKLGRPRLENPKQAVTLRLDADLVAAMRASGKGWQTRANDMLRKAIGLK